MTRTHKKVRYPPKSVLQAVVTVETHKSECSSQNGQEVFRLLEGRWKMDILYQLFGEKSHICRVLRFSELERAIPAISQKMLIQQLRQLENDGIVHRVVYPEVPPRVEYRLTKIGEALRPALRALVAWAELRRKALS